jgi:hypothetical protein
MYQPPWSDVGRLQQDVDSMRSSLLHKADSAEVSTVSRNVDSLEHSLREIRADLDGLLPRVQALEERGIEKE